MAPTAYAHSGMVQRLIRRSAHAYLLLRISTLGFTLLLPLLGAASTQRSLAGTTMLVLVFVGFVFHVFAYVLNDLLDLPIDRTEPLRADSPLVQGRVSPRRAWWLALLQPPLAFFAAALAGASPAALSMLAAAFLLLTAYNLYGKRCPVPLITDAVQALGWCALALCGAFSFAPTLHVDTVWLLAYVFVYVLLINGVHGGVRDLANDLAHGARTTAIWFGARPAAGSGAKLTVGLAVYGFGLQAAMAAFALAVLHTLDYTGTDYWLAAVPVYTALTVATLMLVGLLSRLEDRRRLVAFGATHTFLSLAVLPALYLPMLSPTAAAAVLAVFGLPTIAMYLYNGSHWCL